MEQTVAQFDKEQIIAALRHDPEFFIQFYLHDRLDSPVPQFHVELFKDCTSLTQDPYALAVPRGYAKTTIMKLAIIWIWLFSPYRFVLYVSNTRKIATDEAQDIIDLILNNGNHKAVFGETKFYTASKSEGTWIFEMQDPINGGTKRNILRSLGANQQVRGMNIDHTRPQVLVNDDSEDEENTQTNDQREKFKSWIFGPLFKACDRFAIKIWIGNAIAQHCMIEEFCASNSWRSKKYGCLKTDGTPLWPERFDLEYIKKDFKFHKDHGMLHSWFAEMMNMPIPIGLGLIQPHEIAYKPQLFPDDLQYCFVTIDPAISKQKWADHTGIVVHGYANNCWQIVDTFKGKVKEEELFNQLFEMMMYWKFRVVGMEADAMQHALLSYLTLKFESLKIRDIEFIALTHGHKSKVERIRSFISLIKKDQQGLSGYALTEDDIELTNQMLQFDPGKDKGNDDVVDAAAYGPVMIVQHLPAITFKPLHQIPIIETEAEVCGI